MAVADAVIANYDWFAEPSFSVAPGGTLVYRPGKTERQLFWFDRSGKQIGALSPPDTSEPNSISLSHDGRTVALGRKSGGTSDFDLWLFDIARSVYRRFTFSTENAQSPVWSPDNSQVAFNTGDGWQHVTGGTPAFMVEGSGIGLSQTLTDASHRAFGSNLFVDPCTGCNYYAPGNGSSSGFDVRGPENCNSQSLSWTAVPFVAAKSGVPTRISASIILYNPEWPYNKVTLSLYTDNCDVGPDTPLASGIATVPGAPCDLAIARLRNAPALVQGVKYWVTATTNDQQAGLDATWYASNAAQFALDLGGWTQFTAGTPGFLVQ